MLCLPLGPRVWGLATPKAGFEYIIRFNIYKPNIKRKSLIFGRGTHVDSVLSNQIQIRNSTGKKR